VKDSCYLVLSIDGIKTMKKRPPTMAGNERAIEVSIEAPDELFEYSFIRKEILITEEDMIEPNVAVQVLHHHKEKL